VLHVLGTLPEGIARRQLLDLFAAELVSARSHRGAKGRLALRLYRTLDRLQRKGLVHVEEGLVRLLADNLAVREADPPPLLSAPLRRTLFQALLAEDRSDGQGERLVEARVRFIIQALEEDWTTHQIAEALGTKPGWVAQVVVGL
jgi:hypothetical protein